MCQPSLVAQPLVGANRIYSLDYRIYSSYVQYMLARRYLSDLKKTKWHADRGLCKQTTRLQAEYERQEKGDVG